MIVCNASGFAASFWSSSKLFAISMFTTSKKFDPACKLKVCKSIDSGHAAVVEMSREAGDLLFSAPAAFSLK